MSLEDIPGQQHAARQLRRACESGRLAHAYLFVGPEGVGRTALARELAGVLLCEEAPDEADRCGGCRGCRMFEDKAHPDYQEAGVPEGKQSFPVARIRDLQDTAAVKPTRSDRKVFLLRDVDRMSLEAANCFLKTLEEPPGDAIFLLIAPSTRLLPTTIVSRCQVVRLTNLPPDDVVDRLEDEDLSAEDAAWLARRCWGSPGLARRLAETDVPQVNAKLVDALSDHDVSRNFALSDWLQDEADERADSRSEQRLVLQQLLESVIIFYRDLAVLSATGDADRLFNSGLAGLDLGETDVDGLVDRAEAAFEAIEHVDSNVNEQLALDHLFTRLAARR